MMKRKILMLGALALLLGGVGQARADYTAITLVPGGYSTANVGSFTLGFEFSPTTNITVTALGSYFPADTTDTHGVSLWDANQNLLATTTVMGPGAATDGFSFTPITALLLTAGQDYYVGGTTHGDAYAGYYGSAGATVGTGINYTQHVEYGDNLVAPTFPYYSEGTLSAVYGGNFQYSIATPEPGGFALLGLGIVCLTVGYVVRKRTLALTAA